VKNRNYNSNNRAVVGENGVVAQVTNYYPFGGVFSTTTYNSGDDLQPYKYNGKELDRTHGLDWYDYGARKDVFYFKETDDSLCVLGNLLGSKSSLFVILNKNNNTIIYRKQSAKIDSATHVSCGGRELITVNKSYQDMCTREIFYSIYMLTKDSLKECFDDYKKNEYIGAEDYCSEKFVSYNQFFSFDVIRDSLIVNITKIDENEKKEIKRHSISLK
jgi:hypothetical protein